MAEKYRKFAAMQCATLIDHTLLNANDTEEVVRTFCKVATDAPIKCKAILVHPKFIPFVQKQLKTEIEGLAAFKIASVVNFPLGKDSMEKVLQDTEMLLGYGTDEIDMVIDYTKILEDSSFGIAAAFAMVKSVKAACHSYAAKCGNSTALLKVIIETGKLKDPLLIASVSSAVLEAGADFIKTSTGKAEINATLEAAEVMLKQISCFVEAHPEKKGKVGFKAAGGLKTLDQIIPYVILAQELLGVESIHESIRFGSSSLLKLLIEEVKGNLLTSQTQTYSLQ